MKFTPALKFIHDDSFDTATHMNQLLADPRVRRDIEAVEESTGDNPVSPHEGEGGED